MMVVVTLRNAPRKVRGMFEQVMLEIESGLFVGNCSVKLLTRIFDVIGTMKRGKAIVIHQARTEHGFRLRYFGYEDRFVHDDFNLDLPAFLVKTRE